MRATGEGALVILSTISFGEPRSEIIHMLKLVSSGCIDETAENRHIRKGVGNFTMSASDPPDKTTI